MAKKERIDTKFGIQSPALCFVLKGPWLAGDNGGSSHTRAQSRSTERTRCSRQKGQFGWQSCAQDLGPLDWGKNNILKNAYLASLVPFGKGLPLTKPLCSSLLTNS